MSQYLIRQVWVRDYRLSNTRLHGGVSIPYSSGMGPGRCLFLIHAAPLVSIPYSSGMGPGHDHKNREPQLRESQYLIRQVWVRDWSSPPDRPKPVRSQYLIRQVWVRDLTNEEDPEGERSLNTLFVRYGSGTGDQRKSRRAGASQYLIRQVWVRDPWVMLGVLFLEASQYLIRQVWVRDNPCQRNARRLQVSIPYSSGMGPGQKLWE